MNLTRTMKRFTASSIAASILLFVTAIVAAIVANSPLSPYYQDFLAQEVCLQIGSFNLLSHGGQSLTVLQFINDGLMTIFFLAVGLEIKREVLVGELSSFRKAALPFIAACGGMIFPVLIYIIFCKPGTLEGSGLAIPMATDIAFSLGVLSLLGKRVPLSLKIFLTAFAVVDDIGGILVIALFYSSHLHILYLLAAGVIFFLLWVAGRLRIHNKMIYFFAGVTIWYLFLQSGIHSTISGVLLAFIIPARPKLFVGRYIERIRYLINGFPTMDAKSIVLTNKQISELKRIESASDRVISPLQTIEDSLHNLVNFIILPLFAFANAGVIFSGGGKLVGSVTIAVAAGLLAGKFIGIFSFTWLSVKRKWVPMPEGMNWKNIAGVSLLGGIGFTVSLFIANLSFGETSPVLLNQAKLGVLGGTILAGALGFIVLYIVLPRPKN